MLTQVVGDTPVLTGQARGNWITSIGSPDASSVLFGPYNPSKGAGTTRTGNTSVNVGVAKIKGAAFGVPIYLNNNLPYIARLNDGYSKQAPRNFFAIAIARARGIMKRQAIRYGVKT